MPDDMATLIVCGLFAVLMVIGVVIENWAAVAFSALVIAILAWDIMKDGSD